MKTVIVTGSGGVVGHAAAYYYLNRGFQVVGIDNDMRGTMFGEEASTANNVAALHQAYPSAYKHAPIDIRDEGAVRTVLRAWTKQAHAIIHTAGQPSHDWAATNAHTDCEVNIVGTLNLLEATREFAPHTPFVFCSTNKVYGDSSNGFSYTEYPKRWEPTHVQTFRHGFHEGLSIDHSQHSLFGCSKAAADLYVQEYGRYFGMPTVCFRCGCITGRQHKGVKLHGFLAYLAKCVMEEIHYTVIGYKGKQVRDNIHANDLVRAMDEFVEAPRPAAVYNMGGGRQNSCSVLEAIEKITTAAGKALEWSYEPEERKGDHIWWVSDTRRFQADYPNWELRCSLNEIISLLVGGYND